MRERHRTFSRRRCALHKPYACWAAGSGGRPAVQWCTGCKPACRQARQLLLFALPGSSSRWRRLSDTSADGPVSGPALFPTTAGIRLALREVKDPSQAESPDDCPFAVGEPWPSGPCWGGPARIDTGQPPPRHPWVPGRLFATATVGPESIGGEHPWTRLLAAHIC